MFTCVCALEVAQAGLSGLLELICLRTPVSILVLSVTICDLCEHLCSVCVCVFVCARACVFYAGEPPLCNNETH